MAMKSTMIECICIPSPTTEFNPIINLCYYVLHHEKRQDHNKEYAYKHDSRSTSLSQGRETGDPDQVMEKYIQQKVYSLICHQN